jgi:hypothetical protein
MSKELTIFDQPQQAVPAHIQDAFGDETNIVGRTTVPSLTFEGKVWQISVNGEKQKLYRSTPDGDEPIQTMRVVVLAYNKDRGRSYYEGAYDPGKPGSPLCWSDDGKTPHKAVQNPICASCKACPKAVKGSKINEQGKAVVACGEYRMIAVVPAGKLDMEPLRMKISVTSDWDKNNPELTAQGWFAFNNYTDFLKTRNVKHTAQIVTKIKFDPNVPYPKLVFSPDRWLDSAEVAVVAPVTKSEAVQTLLKGWTPAGADGVKTVTHPPEMLPPVEREEPKAPAVVVPPVKAEVKAEAKAPMLVMDDDDEDEVEAAPPPKVKKTKKAEPVEVEAMEVVKSPSASPAKAGTLSPDLEDILSKWGDE